MLDEAHEGEHSLEVHLPFLQVVLGEFSIVPLVVGLALPEEVAEVLEVLWGGPETLIVVSSDLSHYLPYAEANELDALTASRHREDSARRRSAMIRPAAGSPWAGSSSGPGRRASSVECVDLRNSGDTAGPRNQVVGYGLLRWSVLQIPSSG